MFIKLVVIVTYGYMVTIIVSLLINSLATSLLVIKLILLGASKEWAMR